MIGFEEQKTVILRKMISVILYEAINGADWPTSDNYVSTGKICDNYTEILVSE
jgi:hypothetical protein